MVKNQPKFLSGDLLGVGFSRKPTLSGGEFPNSQRLNPVKGFYLTAFLNLLSLVSTEFTLRGIPYSDFHIGGCFTFQGVMLQGAPLGLAGALFGEPP